MVGAHLVLNQLAQMNHLYFLECYALLFRLRLRKLMLVLLLILVQQLALLEIIFNYFVVSVVGAAGCVA